MSISVLKTPAARPAVTNTINLLAIEKFNVPLPSLADVKREANKAHAENHTGTVAIGRAEQRMIYAVMCECLIMRNDGKTNRALADAHTDAELLRDLNAKLSQELADDKPESDGSESQNVELLAWKKRDKLVRRAVKLGAMLESRGVHFGMFNPNIGLFNVWPSLLYTGTPGGRLANDTTLLLDLRPIVYMTKNAKNEDVPARDKTASMAQVIAICGKPPTPRKPQPTKKAQGTVTHFRTAQDVADNIRFPLLVAAVLVKLEEGGMRKADWPGAFSNLTKVQVAYDELRKSPDYDLPKEADGDKLAATKAKREAQAAASAAKDAAAKASLAAKKSDAA